MNRCSFSEDETTLATRSLKQNTSGGDISKETVAGVWHPDQSHQNFGSHAALPSGRKKHGSKELSNMMYKEDGPIQLSNHTKKSLHAPVTNRGLNDVKPALVVSEPDSLKPSKSNLAVEKHKHKSKDKHRRLDNFSDRGIGFKIVFSAVNFLSLKHKTYFFSKINTRWWFEAIKGERQKGP